MQLVKPKPFLLLMILAGLFVLHGAATAQQPKVSQPANGAEKQQVAVTAPGLADLFLRAGALTERMTDLEESLEETFDPSEAEKDFTRIDVPLVMQILLECATEHKSVLRNPAPRVLFLNFGESSLDFELRIWIGDFTDRRLVQSELNQEIDRRFRSAKVEIPFPQRDLRLRSIDESAASDLESPPAQQSSSMSRKRDEEQYR